MSPIAKAENPRALGEDRVGGQRRTQSAGVEAGGASHEDAVVVILHLDAKQSGKAATQGARHRRGLIEGVAHEHPARGQQAGSEIEPRVRKPIGFVDRVAPADKNVFHDQVEATLLAPEPNQGVFDVQFEFEFVEPEMRPRDLHDLGVEFDADQLGLGGQGAKDPRDAASPQAEEKDPAPPPRGQRQHRGRQGIPYAARRGGLGAVKRGECLVDDEAFAETIGLDAHPRAFFLRRSTHRTPVVRNHPGILGRMTESLFARPSRRTVRVALPVPIDSLFSYRVPDSEVAEIRPGQRVLVPFSGRRLTGVVVECLDLADPSATQHTGIAGQSPGEKNKEPLPSEEIEGVLDPAPVLSAEMLTLLTRAAEEVLCPPGLALAAALPAGSSPRAIKRLVLTPRGEEARRSGGAQGIPARILDEIADTPMESSALLKRLPDARGVLDELLGDGLLRQVDALRGPTARLARERVARVVPGTDVETRCESDLARAPKQAQLLRALAEKGPLVTAQLAERTGAQPAQLRSLITRGLVETFEREAPRNVLGPPVAPEAPLPLTDDQIQVLEPIARCVREGKSRTFLLHGVTGSGKTEIYLRAVHAALEAGRQALILVPEISLTHQIVARLRGRFGDNLAVLHSGLQPSERLEQWYRLQAGDTPIAVGARSALFAPLSNIGVIVVDEEHDSAYKNEQGFRYHAGRLAEELSSLAGCPVVLGSATPALENRHRAERGEIERITLPRRIGGRPLPAVEIVDLAEERRRAPRGRRGILSKTLRQAMQETLAGSAQSILFLNRRGFSTRIFCFDCGFAEHCPNCDVALVYHASEHRLRCHYCEFLKPPPDRCGGCGNTDTALLGAGTERLEEEIRAFLPAARTARLDRDTAQRRGHVRAVLDGLGAGEIDILIGTQMIAKGHDFPGVQLVGVVAADIGLHMPDFRAAERCFQVLTQVAGRAGRAQVPGRVILQSFLPDHYAIRPVLQHDYETFYREELGHRSALGYPPFGRISQVIVSGEDLDSTVQAAQTLADAGRQGLAEPSTPPEACEVLGPVPAAFPRLRGRHRQQIVIKGNDSERVRAVSRLLAERGRRAERGIQVAVDVNPVDML